MARERAEHPLLITLTILSNYYTTYVERDLRQLINLKDLRLFHNFIRLCAGRVGSELNASAMSVEVGIIVTSYGVKKYI